LCFDERKEVPYMGSLWRVTPYVILLVLLTGCYMFSADIVGPDHPSIAPPRAEKPLRLLVGLSGTEEVEVLQNEMFPMTGDFRELKAHFAQELRTLSLFQELLYPVVPHDQPDLTLQVLLQVKFKPDYTEVPKILLTALLLGLTAPLFEAEHHYVARGDLAIIHRNHIVKNYTASSDVIVRIGMLAGHSLRSQPSLMQRAALLARDSMMADLLHQLNQDREFLSQFEPSL
jgi:hypothetical protein